MERAVDSVARAVSTMPFVPMSTLGEWKRRIADALRGAKLVAIDQSLVDRIREADATPFPSGSPFIKEMRDARIALADAVLAALEPTA